MAASTPSLEPCGTPGRAAASAQQQQNCHSKNALLLCEDRTVVTGCSHSDLLQTWSLHSLALVMDQSACLYRIHAAATVILVLRLLLGAPPTHPEVHHSLGRCLHGLITCLGPDLQGSSGHWRLLEVT